MSYNPTTKTMVIKPLAFDYSFYNLVIKLN